MIRNTIKNHCSIFYTMQEIIDINILDEIIAENCKNTRSYWKKERENKNRENNDKKNDKADDEISNIKFANMTSMKSSKYANMFFEKVFNNLLWKNVIYDLDCSDSFTYDLKRFVNEVTLVNELIDISNDSMMIEKYDTMFINDRINDKNRRMFFENTVYVLFIDVTLVFVTQLKKQKYV
jgi:hypothetical protein